VTNWLHGEVRRLRSLLLVLAGLATTAVAAGAATSPAPLSPEGVPVPRGPIFAAVRVVKLGQKIDGIPCQAGEKLDYHVHAHLTVFVEGKAYRVPYGIGVGPPLTGEQTSAGPFVTQGSCIMWLHTHALDGIIHMEAPKRQAFSLGQVFDIWGVKLTTSQVGAYQGKVTTLYDGKMWTGDPRKVPLTNHTEVQLDIGSPVVQAVHITFPKSLGTNLG
jgi:hypothetical protein